MAADRIKQLRERLDLSQQALADLLKATGHPRFKKTNDKRIAAWERGGPDERTPFYAVDGIAHVTGQPLSYFSDFAEDAATPPGAGGGDEEARPPLAERVRVIQAAIQDLVDQARREAGDD